MQIRLRSCRTTTVPQDNGGCPESFPMHFEFSAFSEISVASTSLPLSPKTMVGAPQSYSVHSEFDASSKSVAAPAGSPIPSISVVSSKSVAAPASTIIAHRHNGSIPRSTGRKRTVRPRIGSRSNPQISRRNCARAHSSPSWTRQTLLLLATLQIHLSSTLIEN